MNDDDFIRAIRAHRGDEQQRLVYADWLEERGDADRAEWLRIGCELARLSATAQRRPGLLCRRQEFRARCNGAWVALVSESLAPVDLTASLALGDLRGFLEAFTWVNSKCDHGYSFDVHLLPKVGGLQSALECFFAGQASSVRLSAVNDWREELRTALSGWLCAYLNDDEGIGRLTDTPRRFGLSLPDEPPRLAERVIEKIVALLRPAAVWRVEITQTGFYELFWDDFALEADDRVLLLHLGVSD